MARGIVTFFKPDKGWGAIASDETPGAADVWVHFSAIEIDGYRAFDAGDVVEFEFEEATQDGFALRATCARRIRSGPALELRRRDDGTVEIVGRSPLFSGEAADRDVVELGVGGARLRPVTVSDDAALDAVRDAVRAVEGDVWLPGDDERMRSTADERPDPDCPLVEVDGRIAGATWLERWTEADGTRLLLSIGWLHPEVRRRGIGSAVLAWQEQRQASIAERMDGNGPPILGGNADEGQQDTRALLLSAGYSVAYTRVEMSRDLAEPIPAAPLPPGIEIRPVAAEHARVVYDAVVESFADSRTGHVQAPFAEFLEELDDPGPLWVVAWDGDEVAALALSTVGGDAADTPWVATRPGWRRRGLARAVTAETLVRLRARGARRARLSTIAENPGHSVGVYESVGYRVDLREPRYRKPL